MPNIGSIAGVGAFRPSHSNLGWPAFVPPVDAIVIALSDQLLHSQWWPAEQIEAAQARQLGVLLRHAVTHVPFYRDRLSNLVFDSDGSADIAQLRSLPVLKRAELQVAGQEVHSRENPARLGGPIDFTTSGSTGMPVRVRWNGLANTFVQVTTMRAFLWANADPAGKFTSLRAVAMNPDGTSQEPRGQNWFPAIQCGENAAFNAALPVSQQLKWLRKERPRYLLTYPSNARELARHARDNHIKIDSLESVFTFGESMVEGLAELLDEVFEASLFDRYSAREVGPIALKCPDGPGYHVMSETLCVEILREDGSPAEVGETGRVVVTNLHNFAMPLIRYEIGDHAEVGPPCPCGRGLPTLTNIRGRTRNMLTLPNGDKLWPRFNSDDLNQVAPVRQFQLVQKSLSEIDVTLVVSRDVSGEEEGALTEMLRDRLSPEFSLKFNYVDEIPRSASGKYEDFKSEIAD